MDEIRISSWSDLLLFAKGEVESLKELCAQRDDLYMSGLCDRALGKKSDESVEEGSLRKEDAIVDIAVTNSSSRLPSGFEKIETTMGGSEADLNEGASGKSLFLCVCRQSKIRRSPSNNSFSTPLKDNLRRGRSDADTVLLRRESTGKFGLQLLGTEVVKLSMSSHAAGLRIGHQIQSVEGVSIESQEDILKLFKKFSDSNKHEVKVCVSRSDVSSLAMRPITRLIPVFTDDGGFIPPGWFPVCHFPTGNVADVNAGSGEVILCGERGGGSAVTDIQIIFGDSENLRATLPLPKHRIMWRTLLGQPGDLNHLMSRSRTAIFLALHQNNSWLLGENKPHKDMRLNLVAPLLLCITEPSPKFYRLACESITRLLTKGFFDPPGIGFVPSNHVTSSASSSCRQDNNNDEDTNVIREIRDEVSTLPILDFVLGYLCECFPPTVDPSIKKLGTASKHYVIRDFHKTLIKAFERDEAKHLRTETVFRALWSLFRCIEFLVCEAKASNTMMIRASEDGRSPANVDWFKKRTKKTREVLRESQNCMNRIADCIMLRFINSIRTWCSCQSFEPCSSLSPFIEYENN